MDDTHNDTHLHLERVGEDERVVGAVPRRVDSERVPVRGLDALDNVAGGKVGRPAELRLGEVQREREDVVVDEAGEDGEQAHEEDDVASKVERVEDLVRHGGSAPCSHTAREEGVPRFRCPSCQTSSRAR